MPTEPKVVVSLTLWAYIVIIVLVKGVVDVWVWVVPTGAVPCPFIEHPFHAAQ
jgi:hypothetical protein